MKRKEVEQRIVARRVKLWQSINPDSSLEPGRFRKHKPLDCGHARCYLCHSEKLRSQPSPRQRRQLEQAAEDLRQDFSAYACTADGD